MVINAIAENGDYEPPTQEDLVAWADEYGMTFPVVHDEAWGIENRFREDNGIPTISLLGPGAEVVIRDQWVTEAQIEEVLPR